MLSHPSNVFDVAAERERHTNAKRTLARRRQPATSLAFSTLGSQLATDEQVLADPSATHRRLVELQNLIIEQESALTTAAPEHWRAAAAAYFKTDRQFTLAYLDPPWRYAANANRSCSTDPHYQTMSDDELAAMPLRGLMHTDAAVIMWATAPKMQVATQLLTLWGFEFRTVMLTWIKVTASGQHPIYSTGGSYTRPNAEFLLLATRGKLHVTTSRSSTMIDSVLETRRAEHSHKPNVVRDMIVRVFGDRSRIELFTRETVPGWHAWGNEVTKFNELYATPSGESQTIGDDDGGGDDIVEQDAKRKRVFVPPARPGRRRANNRSAKRTVVKQYKPLRPGARDAGPSSVNSFYNKPADGTKMTINDFVLRGYATSAEGEGGDDDDDDEIGKLRALNRVTDLRALFGSVPSDAKRHTTYLTMTVDEAREAEPLIRRLQEHNDEMLFATNINLARKPVRYSDPQIAQLVHRLSQPSDGGALTQSEDELLNGDDTPAPPPSETIEIEL